MAYNNNCLQYNQPLLKLCNSLRTLHVSFIFIRGQQLLQLLFLLL